MTNEHLSLLISVTAILISGLALGWNVYRDVILKAKVKVSLWIVDIHHESLPEVPQYIKILGTNFGPGRGKIMNIALMKATWIQKVLHTHKLAVVNADWTNELSGKIPSWIEVGDKLDVLLKYDKESFLGKDFSHAGLYDYFGRAHWATSEDLIEARREWEKDFGKAK